jgi:hypothetical protein
MREDFMEYKVSWMVPQRVIEAILPDTCDEKFLRAFDTDLLKMLNTGTKPVHLFIDVRAVSSYPPTNAVLNVKFVRHSDVGRVVTVGATRNPITRFLASMIARSAGIQLKDLSTPDEALAYLRSMENL